MHTLNLENMFDVFPSIHLSNAPTLVTFHYTAWLTGILIMAYYDPYITAWVI